MSLLLLLGAQVDTWGGPTYIGNGGLASGTGDITPSLPTYQDNDILILQVETDRSDAVSTPSGWTLIGSLQSSACSDTNLDSYIHLYWLRCSGTVTAPTITDPGNHCHAVIMCFRGCLSSATPIGAIGSSAGSDAGSTISFNNITTNGSNSLVLLAGCLGGWVTFNTWSYGNLTNGTEIADYGSATGNGGTIGAAVGRLATAGAIGSCSVTHGGGGYAAFAIELLAEATVLVVANCSHGHSAETPTLVQNQTLVVQDASHVHSAETFAITQNFTLVIQDALHSHSCEAPLRIPTTIDEYDGSDDAYFTTGVSYTRVGQTFTAGPGKDIYSIWLKIRKSGSPTGEAVAAIYEVSGGVPVGSALVSSEPRNVPSFSSSVQWEEFAIAYNYGLVSGRTYCVCLEYSTGSTGNTVDVALDTIAPAHGGSTYRYSVIGGWEFVSGCDASFRVLGKSNSSVLTTADCTISHTCEVPTLVQNSTLAVDNCTMAHSCENTVLVQNIVLAINNCLHSHSCDGVTIAQQHLLVVQDALHSHTCDNLGYIEAWLAPADCSHGHSCENVVLTQVHNLTVADCGHSHISENIVLVCDITLVLSPCYHDHSCEVPTLGQVHYLTVSDSYIGHTCDSTFIVQTRLYGLTTIQAMEHNYSIDVIGATYQIESIEHSTDIDLSKHVYDLFNITLKKEVENYR
jgi:hypothetical protein